ncbi:MAG: WG repeat-containing protein [Alistipes sp.]|nr:WG repeat-containing protein [Alistipes sp.]
MTQEKYDIFISYSRKDTAIADKICAALADVGITYFIDRQGIGGGFEFPAVLAENIVNSRIFLLLASKNSYESKFTRSEIIFAFNKKPKNAILPYIIDNSTLPMDLEFVFAGINWRNLTDHPIDPILVDDLLKMLGRKREKKVIEEVMVGGSVNVAKDVVKMKAQPPEQKPTKLEKKSVKVANETAEQISQSTNREKYLLSLPDEDFVWFEKNGRYGYKLKSSGEVVIPLRYDDASDFSEGLALVEFEGKLGFIDKTGQRDWSTPVYDVIESFSEGITLVESMGKYGFIDKTVGKVVIPMKYDKGWFNEGLAMVKLYGKWGFIDKTGNEIIPLKYDDASPFSEGLAKVESNGKWGFIDKTGKEVIPLKYHDANSFSEGLAKVKLYREIFYIDKNGNRIDKFAFSKTNNFKYLKL